ncbi:hypothetical protein ACF0H5_021029 [Mactra antiquata]
MKFKVEILTPYIASVISGFLLLLNQTNGLPACDSKIWCQSSILESIQNARIFPDSKTFVDMNIKYDPDIVISAFANISQSGLRTPTKVQLREFLNTYFEGPNTEFEKWTPEDYTESPAFLDNVKDENLKEFGKFLCKTWKHLGRKIKKEVSTYQERYSLIYLDNPFIIPGGRFRETYYWDSYWVIKGLLLCEMTVTAKGMLQNFISLIERYGMVPNGNRIYYTRRSQPPFLIPMVDLYIEATNDTEFLRESIPFLADEYKFWMTNRSVEYERGQILNHYKTPIDTPRPESFREDQQTQKLQKNRVIYKDLTSAAESGWDFSSRWFSPDFQEISDEKKWLSYTDTSDVIPVDLNSIMCWNERLMGKFYTLLGETNASVHYKEMYNTRVDLMHDVFWDEEAGTWFDHSLLDKNARKRFFPSNIFPLFVRCFESKNGDVEERIVQYLLTTKAINTTSGIPTSLIETGQQWDYPNVWPPLEHIVISGLADSTNHDAKRLAQNLAEDWIESNFLGWKRTGRMFEKYAAMKKGSRGSGGEYDVQEGFGWTNGVALDLLNRYGQRLTIDESLMSSDNTNDATQIMMTSQVLLFILFNCLIITYM